MLAAPAIPMAVLHARSEAGPLTSKKHGSTAAVTSAAARSSGRRPTRSESAPNIGAAAPRSTLSSRNATPTVARLMPATRTK